MIIDGETVITGSFNFTKAAEEKNAENLLVIRDKALAMKYVGKYYKCSEPTGFVNWMAFKGGYMERMDFDEIKKYIDEYFKNLGYEVEFGTENDYRNVVAFTVLDKNKKVVVPEQKPPFDKISNRADLTNYLLWFNSRIKNG